MIALLSLTSAVTACLVSLQLPKVYSSTTVALVNPKQLINTGPSVDPSQLPGIDELVQTYAGLINTDPVRRRLVAAGIDRPAPQLQGSILAVRRPNTTLIDIVTQDSDPAVAHLIALNIIPAFNDSLAELQNKVPGADLNSHLQALVPWEVPSSPPPGPIAPDIPRNTLLGLAAGLVAAAVLALVLERFDVSLKGEADITTTLGIPVLGSIFLRPGLGAERDAEDDTQTVIATNSADPAAEQYRAVRTNLLFSRVDAPLRTLVVTSTAPAEGKTTTACNLAAALAQTGRRVVLVDADFRRPALHSVFKQPQNRGLGDMILGERTAQEALVPSGVRNLRVLCSGLKPPNPAELLGSTSMKNVITELLTLCDIVIFDTPPVGAVTDATILGVVADGVVLVVEQGRTPAAAVKRTVATLQGVNVTLLGAVLNKSRPTPGSADYTYYYAERSDAQGERGRGARRRKLASPDTSQ